MRDFSNLQNAFWPSCLHINEPSIATNPTDVYLPIYLEHFFDPAPYRIPVVSSCGANNLHFYWDSAACEYLQNWSPDFPAPVKH